MTKKLLNELKKYEEENNHQKVIESVDSIIKKDSKTTPLLYDKCIALMNLKKYNEAAECLKEYLKVCDDDEKYEIYSTLAICYHNIDNNELEEKYLLKAFEEQPDNHNITKRITYFYYLQQKYETCIKFINILIKKDLADIKDYTNLTSSYMALGNIEKTIEFANLILDIDPNNVDTYITLSRAYEEADDEENLKKTCQKIINLEDDGTAELLLLKAQSYVQLGEEEKGIELIDNLIKKEPSNPFAHLMKGSIYNQIGKTEQADECFREAIMLEPSLFESEDIKNKFDKSQ